MTEKSYGCNTPQSRAFDFMASEWKVHNNLKLQSGDYMEFEAVNRGEKYIDGCTIIDTFDAVFPNGEPFRGLTIRSYNRHTEEWAIIWLDHRFPPDYIPLKGTFDENGIGTFEKTSTEDDGSTLIRRFIWDNITATTARWRQFISRDDGKTWDNTWIMEFSKTANQSV